ncbi:unnamed protein product [Alopecurus aequalis]
MAAEPVECQVLVLRVSIHCEGCKKKVKKVLLHHDGVYRCEIDGRRNRVTVTASKKIDAGILVARLRKSGKQAEPWPEEPKQEPPAESQETKNQADDASKPNETGDKPAPEAAAQPSNAQPPAPQPEKATEETPPPAEEKKEADETKTETAHQQPTEATEKPNQQHDHQDRAIDARVTMVFDDVRGRGGYGYGSPYQHYMPATRQQPPVHVMSYNQARPMPSSSYYAAAPMPTPAPAPMPMPMSRPGPSQQGGYIDEYAPPSYYSRPAPPSYEPYSYYPDSQPSPYRNHQRSAAEDYYYGAPSLPPQRSAFSPPRDAYGEMFNDENANSCSVM